ncbi:non-ribosomal peptide synthetase [Umezawaea sp. Da 62-37]|uniref:non-ribosomal peptide synthetase n=1 Tax=Umezawaea sp. Da 62-37 TaxID=3075927 RepID=UPI0028F6E6FB|nr:non-ribosomal peptide synthetase [Umezawaea sp. Da 62-37]WNV87748.1 amino acid adenylation domain-containing protein [Umezawaea sp. Da 62-37]
MSLTDDFRLLTAQSEVWTAHEVEPGNPQFNCAGYLDLAGPLRTDLLDRAVALVDAECEALRLRPEPVDGDGSEVLAASLTSVGAGVEHVDLTGAASVAQGEAAARLRMADDLANPLRLDSDPLVRLVLFRLTPEHHLFYLRYHHFLLDGYGQILYWRRLAKVYSALVAGKQPPPGPFGRLADLVDEERDHNASTDFDGDRSYWLDRMTDPPARMDLGGTPEPGQGVLRTIDDIPIAMREVHHAAAALGTHWSAVVIAALAAYLRGLTGHEDVVIGFPVRARTTRLSLTTPAMLSNELPLRLSVPAATTTAGLVAQVDTAIADALRHQRYRGEDLHRALRAENGHAELPAVVANVISFDGTLVFGGCTASVRQLSSGPARELSMDFYGGAQDGPLRLGLNSGTDALGLSDLDAHRVRFGEFLVAFLDAPEDAPVGSLELLGRQERLALGTTFNDTARDHDLSGTLAALVAAQAARTPDAVAVGIGARELTYAELLDRADRLAAHLAERGVRAGDVVGVHDVRSPELVVSLLAVLRAGAAYLPLDPEYPSTRLAFQIADAGVAVVLTRSTLPALVARTAVAVDVVLPTLPAARAPEVEVGPESPAYVIYTSGSTGEPKGVVVPHRGVVNRLMWMRDDYDVGAVDRVLQKTSFSFDVSVWEFFLPLIVGARLQLLEPGAQRDPVLVAESIAEHGITVLHFVPSMLDLFLVDHGHHDLSGLRHVFCSGEALRPSTVAEFFTRFPEGVRLHNLYGPTEASVDVTAWECLPGNDLRTVPIGRPVANTTVHVLDGQGKRVPIGVPGELHVGGVQVALGYLNRPELTAERFIPDPFDGGRLYRTGDLARLRADGVVEFLGRNDHQVKVRGHRIEPGEIEAALLAHPAVRQSVVVAAGGTGARRIVGYVVVDGDFDRDGLRAHLVERLPAYMVPAALVRLDALPLLPNGKVDHGALPEADAPAVESAEPVEPSTSEERLLAGVWASVLGADRVGAEDSFFALGGDSMLAIRVRVALEREHGRTFTVAQLFARPTIRELAPLLTTTGPDSLRSEPFGLLKASDRALLPDGLDDAYPLTSMQAGMLYHISYQENSSVYRVVTSIAVSTALDLDALRTACRDTVARHPQLRCSVDLSRFSEPLQLVHADVDVPVLLGEDLGPLDTDARVLAVEEFVERAKRTVFDPATPPLLRFVVHPCGTDGFRLTAIEHHVLLDGWSDVLMLEEILDCYDGERSGTPRGMDPPRSTYRDFVAAERSALADPEARDFWASALRDATPTTLFGQDGEPGFGMSRTRRFDLDLSASLAARLRKVAADEGLPIKSLLVAAHVMALATASGRDEVLTGLVGNSRLEEAGGDEVIGVFLNTLPLALDLAGATPVEVARRALAWERACSAHRRYPFGQIQRDLGDSSPLGNLRSYVNFMDFHRDRYRARRAELGASIGVADTNYPVAVDFLVEPGTGRLLGWLDCDVAALPEELCERLAGYHQRALEAIAGDRGRPVSEIDLLSGQEHRELASWHGPATGYDTTATLHGMFEAQAARTPDARAASHRWDGITYAELDASANRVAHRLVQAGVRRGDLVGVGVHRGTRLLVSLLGVLKAGAGYVPMDPAFPLPRLLGIATDAGITCLLTAAGTPEELTGALTCPVVDIDAEHVVLAGLPATPPEVVSGSDDRAYVMYTSGSTGAPKGAQLTHRNVVNFFAGMDDRVGCGPEDVVLAVTSVSFDISVLELLWPLTRGAHVVVADEGIIRNLVRPDRESRSEQALGFSLFFFAAAAGEQDAGEGYRLVLDAARYADAHGFRAIWTPERHGHEFGGLYPNPSVMSAALATITQRIGLRSGSVVAPLHDPVRLAEEWSLVDNLSRGRVGLAFASGWNSNDFVFQPGNFPDRKKVMVEHLDQFRALWRGDPVERIGGSGETVRVRVFPRPVQAEPPIWLTSVGTVSTFRQAGADGVNLLTHLLGQRPDALAEKISAYREARADAGHAGPGQVTLMVHTFMSDDPRQARARAREPFRAYLRSSTELWRTMFASTGQDFPDQDAESYVDAVIEQAIDRYFETSGLFGSPETCAPLVRDLADAGVDEIACLIDFGVPTDAALESLVRVDRLRRDHEDEVARAPHSLRDLCLRHGVTLAQGTPSLLSAVATEPSALAALGSVRALLVGGEAFPSGLARKLLDSLPGVRVLNMYGPTETTIWSTVHELDPADERGTVPIGLPIANTSVRVLDEHARDVPLGVSGELWIGGDGVAAGYLDRPELTEERFVVLDGSRFYRTGDRVRRGAGGVLEFLGRVDRQVKIHGHRVEPDEVESVLSRHPDVEAVAVVAVTGATGAELVAYVTPTGAHGDPAAEQTHVRGWAEVWQQTYQPDRAGEDDEFAGWASSYTGEPIPAGQMREWLGHTVERIAGHAPDAIADIGVGVGLVLRSLAERTSEYHGVDISPAALATAARCLGDRPLPEHVRLVRGGPEYLEGLATDSLDAVVLNSVVQYFPGPQYLRRVLVEAARVVRPGGVVHVGDIRSVRVLPEFHTSVVLHRAPILQPAEEVRATVTRHVRDESELCLSPAFFHRLAEECADIGEVRAELKRGRSDNELTAFRFDVALHIGPPPVVAPATTVAWADVADDLDGFLAAEPGAVVVTGVPNRRLARHAAAVDLLDGLPDTATVWDLERLLWEVDEETAPHPEDLVDAAGRAGRAVSLVVPADGSLRTTAAHFTRARVDRTENSA